MHDYRNISLSERKAGEFSGAVSFLKKALAVSLAGFVLMNPVQAREEARDTAAENKKPARESLANFSRGSFIPNNFKNEQKILVKKIPDLQNNPRSREFQKSEIIRLMNLSRDVCDRYKESDPESIICHNPKLMYLEEEYLKYLGLQYDEHGCVFGCALHRGRLNTCVKNRFSSSCAENYFELMIAEERIDQGTEEHQEMLLDCVPGRKAAENENADSEGRHQLVILKMYSTQLPVGHFSIKGEDYSVYGFPQHKGEYLRDISSICYDCDYSTQLKFVDSGRVEIELRNQQGSSYMNCEIH